MGCEERTEQRPCYADGVRDIPHGCPTPGIVQVGEAEPRVKPSNVDCGQLQICPIEQIRQRLDVGCRG